MNPIDLLLQSTNGQILPATVTAIDPDGAVSVSHGGEVRLRCRILETSNAGILRLACGDEVLVWQSGEEGGLSVVLGRIAVSAATEDTRQCPDELVLEATRDIRMVCGDSSITLRSDGKILIRGNDIVSRATRSNRLKGGSVAIN